MRGQAVSGGINQGAVAITGGTISGVAITNSSGVALAFTGSLPFIKPASGTMSNNGAFTNGTALARTVPKCYMYFSANQIAAGVAAGWYYAEGSSSTAFTVYNNTYTSGNPSVPTSKTPFVTTGPGATTGVTTEVAAQQIDIQNLLGAYGAMMGWITWSMTNNANSHTVRLYLGGTGGTLYTFAAGSSNASGMFGFHFWNSGDTGKQIGPAGLAAFEGVQGATNVTTSSIDTTASTMVTISLQGTTATDNVVAEGFYYLLTQRTS